MTENVEQFVKVGLALREIKDDRLYEAAGHASFKAYLASAKSRFNMDERHAYRLISAAELREVSAAGHAGQSEPVWTEGAMRPLAELAQTDKRSAKKIAEKLEREHVKGGNGAAKRPISSAQVREALVAEGLAKKPTKRERSPLAKRQHFDDVARGWVGRLNGIADVLERGTKSELTWLRTEHPDICRGLAKAIGRVEKAVQRVWNSIEP